MVRFLNKTLAEKWRIVNLLEEKNGADEGIRTLDPNLGKVMLYP